MLPFVEGFFPTPSGKVPQVTTRLSLIDHMGTMRARIGMRTDYMVQPGLYRVGEAGPHSPVIVTANYKLTFDAVRTELSGVDCWLLIVDTDGINVWCAGGKGKFNAEAVAAVVRASGLEKVVNHRELVLPQLAANGVSAHALRRLCGFRGVFGPVAAHDLKAFLENGHKADEAMRRVTFSMAERLVLAPVEVSMALKWVAVVTVAGFLLSGIGPSSWSFWSVSAAFSRAGMVLWATLAGLLCGAVAVPALLPWLPGRSFALKGAVAGLASAGLLLWPLLRGAASPGELVALSAWLVAISSFMGMNFTGSTPYTSPSGVEREMRRAIPLQISAAAAGVALWLAVPFL